MLLNKPRAIEYMRHYGLDALVASSPVHITYLTDYHFWLSAFFKEYMVSPGRSSRLLQSYAVLPEQGEPVLVIPPTYAPAAGSSWVRDLHFSGKPGFDFRLAGKPNGDRDQSLWERLQGQQQSASPDEALFAVLQNRGLSSACIGFEMEGVSEQTVEAIRGKFPKAVFKDCTNLLRLLRMVKSEEELRRIKRSAEINEVAGRRSMSTARPGMDMGELANSYRKQVAEENADFEHFAYSINGFGIATEAPHTLSEDELSFVDYGCIYEHYYSDTGTTFAMRPPERKYLDLHRALRDCIDAGMGAVRPGVKASSVHAAMLQALGKHGSIRTAPLGHSLGLEIREYPMIVADNGLKISDDCVDVPSDLPLEENMVFNLESAIFMPAVGALHLEQTIWLTAQGGRLLIDQDRSGPIMPN